MEHNQSDLAADIARAQEAAQNDPANPTAWENLGILLLVDASSDARFSFERLVSVRPDTRSFVLLGRALMAEGDIARAIETLEGAQRRDPTSGDVSSALGVAYLFAGRIEEAERSFQKAADADETNEEAYSGLARLAFSRAEFERTIGLCASILRHAPNDELSPLFLLGDSYLALGALPQAEQAYSTAAQIDPTDANAVIALAQVHLLTGDVGRAEGGLRRAIALDPASVEAHMGLGNLYTIRDRPRTARVHYSKALELNPDYIPAYGPLAANWMIDANLDEARVVAEAAIARVPNDAASLKVLAQVEELSDNLERAEQVARRATAASPDDHQTYLILARVMIRLGRDRTDSLNALSRAEGLAPPGEERAAIERLKAEMKRSTTR